MERMGRQLKNATGYSSNLGAAWLLLCFAIAMHVLDEALSGFLSVYNPTVLALRQRLPWLPLPVFTFRFWLLGLSIGVVILFFLSKFVVRGARWSRVLAYILALLMIVNAAMHIVGTWLGHTVASVRFAHPMPGFYSSPLLLGASIYLLVQLGHFSETRLAENRKSIPNP
jgi:hypothetical protein